jgi:hypothetical protein
MILDRGNHAGMLYLSDPHWFLLLTLNYLKHWQARDVGHVTAVAPPLDALVDGDLEGAAATYRLVVRNHGSKAVGPLDVHVGLPAGARLERCWVGFEGLGRCVAEGTRVTWTVPRLPGGKTTVGPFVVSADVAAVKPGRIEATVWVTAVDGEASFDLKHSVTTPQHVSLEAR